jgi:predicted acylesterase/phospholipase RssA/CRP-like cAMP-binding protein
MLLTAVRTDMHPETEALRQSSVFGGLPAAALDAVVASLEPLFLEGGEVLFRQGDAGDAAYVVLSGRVRIERDTPSGREVVREAGRGELIGEFALLTGAARTATVRASRHCELGRIRRERFDALLAEHGTLAIGISRNLASQLAEMPARRRSRVYPSVVVLRAITAGLNVEAVGRQLADALCADRRCALLTAADARTELDADASAGVDGTARTIAMARWLERVESSHDVMVCVVDGQYAAWDRACLQQADIVMDLMGSAPSASVATGVVDTAISCARELLVVHQGSRSKSTGAAAALTTAPYNHHHHLLLGAPADFARIARHLTGRRIGLVLGGGGARGFAHIGVLRAAMALGIPIDEIGGTSIGALLAAQWAAGVSLDDMIASHRRGWSAYNPHKAYTLPLIGLVRASAMRRMLDEMLGAQLFEDCVIESFACSCNLNIPGVAIHRRGSLVNACMASMAIPGLGPAVTMPDRSLHVDGGLVSNLPARHLRSPRIIVSDVSSVQIHPSGYEQTPSAWQILRDRFRPVADRPYYSSLANTLVVSTLVGSVREGQRISEIADVFVRPPIAQVSLFEFHRLDEAVEAGYREGMTSLAGAFDTAGKTPEASQ